MAQSCAIVACDHGLGHIRRCALIAKRREEMGDNVTLFAPVNSVKHLQKVSPYLADLSVSNFRSLTRPHNFKNSLQEIIRPVVSSLELDVYDLVISDNLLEVLEIRNDAVISAQFFWHKSIDNVNHEYSAYCEHLLAVYSPQILGCRFFSMESVRKQPRYTPTNLYQNPDLVHASINRVSTNHQNLLVTGGSTSIVKNYLKNIVSLILEYRPALFRQVFVDQLLLPPNPPDWMIKADYSIDMYIKTTHAICRPGLGTITDLLTVGAYIYPIYETGNYEMSHNHQCLLSFFPDNCKDFSLLIQLMRGLA